MALPRAHYPTIYDPLVLAHARALLTNTTDAGVTAYVDADFHDPDLIVSDARNVLDFTRPIGVMFMGVLGFCADYDELRSIVARVIGAVPSGSYLIFWDATNTTEAMRVGTRAYNEGGTVPYNLRSPEQIQAVFDGLELVEPGVVPLTAWRPNKVEVGSQALDVDAYCGVGRKP